MEGGGWRVEGGGWKFEESGFAGPWRPQVTDAHSNRKRAPAWGSEARSLKPSSASWRKLAVRTCGVKKAVWLRVKVSCQVPGKESMQALIDLITVPQHPPDCESMATSYVWSECEIWGTYGKVSKLAPSASTAPPPPPPQRPDRPPKLLVTSPDRFRTRTVTEPGRFSARKPSHE